MTRRAETANSIRKSGVVAVVRTRESDRVTAIAEALLEGGLTAIEITTSVPGAVDVLRTLSSALGNRVLLGAGTVLDLETARRVIDAGARFVASPIFRRGLLGLCHDHDVAVAPGCFTPTEIFEAWEAGADFVKVFPAATLGPAYFRELRGPLPHLPIMPTGGVTLDNVTDWINAGAVAVGVETALLDPQAIASGHYGVLTARASAFLAAVKQARGG
ncbi:MAG TPA: bifunctional 4-hydroxy-2-oxoglutarate aldolase/2-dehydro-3-deoxy-phosphogluconate aldolase [Polyangiaceae bacterium]|nr:bifunctional 4-hydroxy-2-oxoglutarate aldolase/2-dehydro-3-deoxy-phosphogluconate aldolase [Polyangiaceae bacterium]